MAELSIKYTVHGVSRATVQRTVQIGGADVDAQVPCAVVELVAEGAGHSFAFIGQDAAAALALFEPGGKITATFTKGK